MTNADVVFSDALTREEFRDRGFNTSDYHYNSIPGEFRATLDMKAEGHPGILRLFFTFKDGRKIIAPVYEFHDFLGFYKIPDGTEVILSYRKTIHGTFLVEARKHEE
jgi:hypothetical protein